MSVSAARSAHSMCGSNFAFPRIMMTVTSVGSSDMPASHSTIQQKACHAQHARCEFPVIRPRTALMVLARSENCRVPVLHFFLTPVSVRNNMFAAQAFEAATKAAMAAQPGGLPAAAQRCRWRRWVARTVSSKLWPFATTSNATLASRASCWSSANALAVEAPAGLAAAAPKRQLCRSARKCSTTSPLSRAPCQTRCCWPTCAQRDVARPQAHQA